MTTERARRRVIAVAVLAAGLTAGAACSGGEERPTLRSVSLESVLAATREAETMSVSGSVVSATGEDLGDVAGAVDAASDRADLRYPLTISVAFSAGGAVPVHILRDGKTAYIERTLVAGADAEAVSNNPLLYGEGDHKWLRVPADDPVVRAGLAVHDPLRVLEGLVQARAALGTAKPDPLDGTEATRYEVVVEPAWLSSKAELTKAGATVWIDEQGRLLRLRIKARELTVDYTVGGFGDSPEVEVPADSETATTAPVTTAPGGDAPQPTGDYAPVGSGTTGAVPWTLERAPGENGTSCWRLVYDGDPSTQADEEHRCVAPALPDDGPVDGVSFAVRPTTPTGSLHGLVVLLGREPRSARFGFRDGTWQAATYDTDLGALVWTGPAGTEPLVVELDAADGTDVVCAPGTIMGMEDVDGLDESEAAEAALQPWSCEAPEAG